MILRFSVPARSGSRATVAAASPSSTAVIGVLTWKGYEATKACLESLRILQGWPIPTVVVDNGSGTGEGRQLAEEFGPPIEVIELDADGGVPSGYNAAVQWAADRGADNVLLLNNDTVISDPLMVSRLLDASGPGVGVVGPIIRDADGSIFSAGGSLSLRKGASRHHRRPLDQVPYPVDWLDGPAMLMSIRAAKAVGGLAPDYFLYWEELDWCMRARRAGFSCVLQPRTSISHLRGGAAESGFVRYQMARNRFLFMRRNGSSVENLTSLAWTLRTFVRRSGHVTEAGIVLRALGWNVADAVRRRRWRIPATGPEVAR